MPASALPNSAADVALTGLDRWILAQFGALEERVIAAYARYEFHSVYQQLSQFAAVELSSIYQRGEACLQTTTQAGATWT